MSFALTDDSHRRIEVDTDNALNLDSVFIQCGEFCIELSRAAFFDCMLEEVKNHEFYRLAWMAKFGPLYERVA